MKKLMAFWRYDTFPWLLHGEVDDFRSGGLVYVKAYQGTFRPLLILPFKEGEELAEHLEDLREEHNQAHLDVNEQFSEKLEALLTNYKLQVEHGRVSNE